jgi:glycosyltransferase 2 family protein
VVRTFWRFALKAAVTIVLLWLPLRHVALRAVLAEMSAVDVRAILISLLILCSSTLIAAIRWSVILRAIEMPRRVWSTYPMTLIGLFFSQALPAGLGGDAVRIWLGWRTGLTLRVVVSSIVGDRLTGLLTILLIVTAQLPRVRGLFPSPAFFASLCVALTAGYIAFVLVMVLDKLPGSWRSLRVISEIAALSSNIRHVLLSRAGIPVLACSIAIQCCNIGAVFALTRGLHLPVALSNVALVVPLATVLQTLPISIAGWGIRESFFVLAFGIVGIAASQALAVSVLLGLLTIVSSLPGGVLWLALDLGAPNEVSASHQREQ